jgi:hypothetical protein
MSSFGREVKPFAPCRRFAACKRSLNVVKKASFRKNYRTPFLPSSTFRYYKRSRCWGRGGIWRRKWERPKAGESNGNLPLRTCPECSVPEPYRSPDRTFFPAKPAQGLNTNVNNMFWNFTYLLKNKWLHCDYEIIDIFC